MVCVRLTVLVPSPQSSQRGCASVWVDWSVLPARSASGLACALSPLFAERVGISIVQPDKHKQDDDDTHTKSCRRH